jgi:hypothetical protein
MKALTFLLGEWEGNGWIAFGPENRNEFSQTERVESRLNGLVVLVEGTGKDKGSGESKVVHHALAVISYDLKAERYRFAAHTADGRYVDATATVGDRDVQWGFESPWGPVRYTIQVTDDGEWFEIGENSRDGSSWQKFFEMRLRRIR